MEQELQLQKQLTRVIMEMVNVTDVRTLVEEERMIWRALEHLQKDRAGLEAETRDLEAAVMQRQREMVQVALRLEREMEEVVKHKEMVLVARAREYEASRLKNMSQTREVASHQDSKAPREFTFLGENVAGIEAVAVSDPRGRRDEESSEGDLVFGDLEKDGYVMKSTAENEEASLCVLNQKANQEDTMQRQTTTVKQVQRNLTEGREKLDRSCKVEWKGDGNVKVANRSIKADRIVDITNNSTFEFYNSDEDHSQMEVHVPPEHSNEEQLVIASLPKEVVFGQVEDGLNNKEVLAQQEEILEQIKREHEAEEKTRELVAKLALSDGEGDFKQVVAERQEVDERQIGTDLSEFINVAIKKRKMNMARKSGGSTSDVLPETKTEGRRYGGEGNVCDQKNEEAIHELEVELEAEKKKQVKELTRQGTPAKVPITFDLFFDSNVRCFPQGSEAQVVPMRNEAASRVIEEAKKKR